MTRLATNDSAGIARALETCEPFATHGALQGKPVNASLYFGKVTGFELGRLPRAWEDVMERHMKDGAAIDYVVYSYDTPIAWREVDGAGAHSWVVPGVKYSPTTTRHQSTVQGAIARQSANA